MPTGVGSGLVPPVDSVPTGVGSGVAPPVHFVYAHWSGLGAGPSRTLGLGPLEWTLSFEHILGRKLLVSWNPCQAKQNWNFLGKKQEEMEIG